MMDVNKILDDYEDAQARKAREKEEKLLAEAAKKRMRAETIQTFIRENVLPIFKETEQTLNERGYKAEVSTATKTDYTVGSDEEFVLTATLAVAPNDVASFTDKRLSYTGSFDEEALAMAQEFGTGPAKKLRPEPLSLFGRDRVESNIESFLKTVFVAD